MGTAPAWSSSSEVNKRSGKRARGQCCTWVPGLDHLEAEEKWLGKMFSKEFVGVQQQGCPASKEADIGSKVTNTCPSPHALNTTRACWLPWTPPEWVPDGGCQDIVRSPAVFKAPEPDELTHNLTTSRVGLSSEASPLSQYQSTVGQPPGAGTVRSQLGWWRGLDSAGCSHHIGLASLQPSSQLVPPRLVATSRHVLTQPHGAGSSMVRQDVPNMDRPRSKPHMLQKGGRQSKSCLWASGLYVPELQPQAGLPSTSLERAAQQHLGPGDLVCPAICTHVPLLL